MRPEIEAHYLGLEWLERGRARRVEVAPDPVDIELGPDGVLRMETQIFHDFHPWLGLRLTGRLAGSTPAFVDAQGQKHPMLALDDGDGGVWWVQNDGWDAIGQRHLSELHRTMGRFEVVIDSQRLLIENLETDVGHAQLDEYLQEFKHDLIWLVLSAGTASIPGAGAIFGNELPTALLGFASAAARVSARPARALREISANTPRSRLRPNAATFRQHARTPASRNLVGRASEETADTADNRYLRHMVQACDRLARTTAQAAQRQAARFADRSRFEDERSKSYGSTSSRLVDPEIFDRQLAELKEKLERLADWSEATPDDQDGDFPDYCMEIGKRYGYREDEYFYVKPEGRSTFDEEREIQYNVVRLPQELGMRMVAVKDFCKKYTLSGPAAITIERSSNGKQYRRVIFSRIVSVKPDRHALEAKQRTRERLESRGWRYELSRAEREEMQREALTAEMRAKTYLEVAGRATAAGSALASCQAALRQQDALWESLEVSPQSKFPMGMRYALSPDYVAVLKAFAGVRALAERAGIGDESMNELDRIGVLHASAVYERWCLTKIIGVLIEGFGFEPDPGWQEVVIRSVTGRPDSASLQFHRYDVGVSAKLDIQPLLENGRRPDFRLRFDSDSDPVAAGALVMDAKFRTRWQRGALPALLTELVESKGYGGGSDRVFILQPQAYVVLEPTSPLAWGQHCDYGQDFPVDHRTGSIQLAAGAQSGGARHNLRRLLAMGIQSVFPLPNLADDVAATSNSFCIRCGTRHTSGDIEERTTGRGRSYWSLNCCRCGMESIRTHCYGCGETLFKNGTDLTYHRTLADQITNVGCPKCGVYFDRDFYGGG